MNLLDGGLIRRIRQHHAIEHATITLLMARNRGLSLVGGRSDHRGFYIVGAVDTDRLAAAADEALRRLQRGEAELAIHPNCGTNLVTTGAMTGLAALGASAISRRRQAGLADRVAAAVLAATAAALASKPLGLRSAAPCDHPGRRGRAAHRVHHPPPTGSHGDPLRGHRQRPLIFAALDHRRQPSRVEAMQP
ncbi:MAG: DUF6391 domain-containing protein [Anaerolineae bacterium]